MEYWKKTDFWGKIKDSCALGTFMVEGGLILGDSQDFWKGLVLTLGAIGYLLGIWFRDDNKDGVVDLFEDNK